MSAWKVRGLRGATTVEANDREAILSATEELLRALVEANDLHLDEVASVLFTVTADLNAEFPALAARRMGWLQTPLLCTTEIPVPGGMERCIRVLIHVNTTKEQNEMRHVYLREAQKLRPDLQRG